MNHNKFKTVFLFIVFFTVNMIGFASSPPAGANNCSGATSLAGATSGSTCTTLTLSGSTITGDPLATCNTTTENTSIWYKFVASATNLTIVGDNAATSGTICQHSVAVYSGASCASLTEIGCGFGFDAVSYSGTTFTVGQTYFVQTSYSAGGPCGDLDVCTYVCPTASNDVCTGSTNITTVPQASSNACTTPGPTTNTPTITPADLCAGSLENTAWYSFLVQNTANVVVSITGITCTGGGAGFQIGFFTGACGSLSNFGCASGAGGSITTTITGLTAGQIVTLAIDGNAGAVCTFNISATNTIPLPIELVRFDAEYGNEKVDLKWITASEKNNDYFTVEKTLDGINFSTVAQMSGAPGGNSSSTLIYNSIDPNPESGLIYYRLKQTDFDGKVEYSNLAPVLIEGENDIFNIKPNPSNGFAEISYRSHADERAKLTVYDYNGRFVYSRDVYCLKGENSTDLQLTNEPDGMYFVTLTTNTKVHKTKLVKKSN